MHGKNIYIFYFFFNDKRRYIILFLFTAGTEGAESARYTGTENGEIKPFLYALLIYAQQKQ